MFVLFAHHQPPRDIFHRPKVECDQQDAKDKDHNIVARKPRPDQVDEQRGQLERNVEERRRRMPLRLRINLALLVNKAL